MERYANNSAALANAGLLGGALVSESDEATKVSRVDVYGNVSPEVIDGARAHFGHAEAWRHWGGYTRS